MWLNVVSAQGEIQVPVFNVPAVNVTAVAGQTAVLPCTIQHVGDRNVRNFMPIEINYPEKVYINFVEPYYFNPDWPFLLKAIKSIYMKIQ